MSQKKNYMFTNRRHSEKAIMSTVFGVLCTVSLVIVVVLSYSRSGDVPAGYGFTGLFAAILSLVGMLLGVLALREAEQDIVLECARPCETQADSWPEPERRRYQAILDQCNFETLVQHSYDRFCMIRRNRYMVDRSGLLIAIYNGVPKGGTFQTLAYAMQKGLTVHTIDLEDFYQ